MTSDDLNNISIEGLFCVKYIDNKSESMVMLMETADVTTAVRYKQTITLVMGASLMNEHFINELDKIGLQLIKITLR